MNKSKPLDIIEKFELGVNRGVARALSNHKKAGHSIYVWKDGKVVEIPPEKIQVDMDYLPSK